jgi:glycine/D-amino acid oxidase-like deaminating enzyme/nitrite reductase/ring-hydroxylating ferredoxin subunit
MGSAYFDAHSLWGKSDRPLFTALTENTNVDTCVVGAGISGLSTAYQLLRAGQQVVVLDRERIGLGETGLTSAHLSNALDASYQRLKREHGREGVRLAAESHTAAIDEIERIVSAENIDCDFRRVSGYLFLGPDQDMSYLVNEMQAAHEAGLSEVELLQNPEIPLFDLGPCLRYPNQAQFHPLRYLDGLAEAVTRLGGRIFTHTEATEIMGGPNASVKTRQGYRIACDNIVVATNVPINNRIVIHTKNPAYRTYVIGLELRSDQIVPALFWDTADPYHYLRFVKDPVTQGDILLVGGGDHRTGQDTEPEDHFNLLRRWLKTRFDIDARVVTRWSGQINQAIDGLAFIGANPGDEENVYIITGDHGHGMTHGTLAGLLLRDLILRIDNPWAKVYDPARLHFRSLATYLKETANSTAPYSDWFSDGDLKDAHQIEAGEGAVLREGLRKIAVYKDEMNRLYACSAMCPHLGGVVRWNSAEKTWDCPCHGSRFDRFGQVINGPANQDLTPAPEPYAPNTETIREI